MNYFSLNTLYSVWTFLCFYLITNFYSHFRHSYYDYFCIIVFFIVITIIISSFSMLITLISLVFTILFYLCIYRIFFNFKQMTCDQILLKVGNKDTETVLVSLMGTLNTVCLTYSSDNFLLKWHYFILPLTIISFIL